MCRFGVWHWKKVRNGEAICLLRKNNGELNVVQYSHVHSGGRK